MPAKRICKCGKLIDITEIYCTDCAVHKDKLKKDYEKQRGTSSERGYNSRWRSYRMSYLRKNPLCVICLRDRQVVPANVIDHIIPHKGDAKLFWDTANHQSLCKKCHDTKTAKEDGGFGNMRKG